MRMLRTATLAAALAAMTALAAPALAQDTKPAADGLAVATFAGGCFWCMEPPFDKLDGVVSTISGYTGGSVVNPSYKQVSAGGTGHTEAVEIRYDPKRVSFQTLLDTYWHNVDAVDGGGQFCDRGSQYRPAIFVHDEEQRRLAEESKKALDGRFAKPIAVTIGPAETFYPAEDYHQNYYQNNPVRYTYYRYACGRDKRLEELWGPKPSG
ncbi:peptide-methionine (S)-S-oxide reductase MsrA [Azospirillum sp. RWY-5-1]|uniref:Peptide methionine sulfoxide reductase MsrA n=2 Tax=Azospirillum oleiclasticum TaxID=2735135 RepID=A0ABX2T5M4_9PROT|nr:peptide-methionine (S)-S-oxide reductase MsrA [Azospirillum oleiclasticum]NYZ19471.1 peptide-methionine (S)-S-oxide reductase MsrA [Azospirillum oleiclasticum]